MAIKLEDFLPKTVEVEYKDKKFILKEPTIEDLLEIQSISLKIEKWEINEVEGAIKILALLSDNKEEFEKILKLMPYSKLLDFQKQVFKQLGLGTNEVENETVKQ